MSKQKSANTFSTNHPLFEGLDAYREFCVDYGYKFDEATFGDMRNYAFQQFSKYNSNKNFRDQWADDAKRMESAVSL